MTDHLSRETDDVASLTDPESLRDRGDVEFVEETVALDPEEFEAVREDVETWDDHVVVGVTSAEDEVLLMNDGSHGWTLTAFPVESGEDWLATARHGFEDLTGVAVDVDRLERVRRIDYVREADDEHLTSVYNVVVRASFAGDADPELAVDDAAPDVQWFDDVPEDQEAAVADDVRLFVE